MDSIKVVMITGKSNLQFITDELGDVLTHKDIVLKVVDDQTFDNMFATKRSIDVDIPDDLFLELAKEAHKQDITFNELATKAIREQIQLLEKADDPD